MVREWEQRKLGELADFFNEKRIPIDSSLRKPGRYPYYGASGIIDYVHDYIFDGEYVLLAEDGANIIMRNSPIAYLTHGKFWLNNHAHIMRLRDGCNSFLLQVLENKNYLRYNTGTAQPKLNGEVVKKIIFTFPSSEEQNKIGKFFKQLDEMIALHQAAIQRQQDLKKGLLQQLFPAKDEEIPAVRFTPFTEKWEQRKLEGVAQIIMGQSPKGENYTENPNDYILVQGNADIKNGRVFPRSWTTQVTKEAEPNDIILSVRAPVGDVGKTDYNVVLGRGVAGIKGNDFIFQSLIRMKVMGFWIRYSTGSTFESINSTDIKEAEVSVPIEEEQQKIGSFFKMLDNTIVLHQAAIQQHKKLKKSLLQKMFVN
ncbi:restriction endonuclease subunit S [Enterococcus sp.]|uniref:restriction endonuclease subunit S n=1 Tax=Enterococcus sp. TaxID=35783 RepID=UPI002FC8682A